MKSRIDETERLFELTKYERELWEMGLTVCGMDEVGRGPLAGPVVVCKKQMGMTAQLFHMTDGLQRAEQAAFHGSGIWFEQDDARLQIVRTGHFRREGSVLGPGGMQHHARSVFPVDVHSPDDGFSGKSGLQYGQHLFTFSVHGDDTDFGDRTKFLEQHRQVEHG